MNWLGQKVEPEPAQPSRPTTPGTPSSSMSPAPSSAPREMPQSAPAPATRGASIGKSIHIKGELTGSEDLAIEEIIKGLDAETVASAEEFFLVFVPEHEGEHAAIVLKAALLVGLKGVDDGFRIAVAVIAVAEAFEIGAEAGVIEDFAVIGDPKGFILIGHGLGAAGEIDDGEASMAERGIIILVVSEAIGAAMDDGVVHPPEDRSRIGPDPRRYVASNATHK